MRVLDLFCCAGGAARGYQLAGATVRGVDIVPRPNYCGEQFFRGDALRYLSDYVESTRLLFDLVHTSPPCQAGCTLTNGTNKANGWGADHEQFVPRTRELLDAIGPYVAAYGSGGGKATVAEMQHALCMDWTTEREELTEAIPPAYTRHIGQFFAASLAQSGRLDL